MPTTTEVSCPKCGGAMWDNRASKRNPKQPDYKCRDRSCDGVVWPPRDTNGNGAPKPAAAPAASTKQAFTQGPALPYERADADAPVDSTATETAATRRVALFRLHNVCFEQAIMLANSADANHGIKATIEGVSALTAQLFIAATQRGAA